MPEARYPTLDEFWRRLSERDVEEDLRASLDGRTSREGQPLGRLPAGVTVAVAARLLPGAVPPAALAAFLDEYHDQQVGRGDDKVDVLPRPELIPIGLRLLDEVAMSRHGAPFAELPPEQQDELLATAEKGGLDGPDGFDSATWFKRTRGYLFLAYGSDPRGMVEMGFPGPSYRPGHIWLDEGEVAARAARKPGYRVL